MTSDVTWSPMAIWFVTSAVPCGKAVFQTLNESTICFLPLYLPLGSDVSASSAYGARSMSPLAIEAIHCLIVAVLAAAVDRSCTTVVGLSCVSVIDALLSVATLHSILANSKQQIIK